MTTKSAGATDERAAFEVWAHKRFPGVSFARPERFTQFRPLPPNFGVNISDLKTPQWLLDKMRQFSRSSGT